MTTPASLPRFVDNPAADREEQPGEERPGASELLPDASRLEVARDLAGRFAGFGLVPCAVVPCPPLSRSGMRVSLALESMQVTGSFKVRGAFMALEQLRREGHPLEIVAASAGNHGAGIAYAAKALGAQVTVIVPSTAPKTKVDKIVAYGATVRSASAPGYDGAEREAIALAASRGVPYVSPYDDLDVLTGNGASLGFEIVRALGRVPTDVYCPFGGGGLATGLACALAHEARARRAGPRPRVLGIQTAASAAFAMSLSRGAAVESLPAAETLAEGLEGGLPARAFARARAVVAGAVVVSEASIAQAMRFALRELGLVVEGSAAAAIAPLLAGEPPGQVGADVVVVLTGRNVDRERLAELC